MCWVPRSWKAMPSIREPLDALPGQTRSLCTHLYRRSITKPYQNGACNDRRQWNEWSKRHCWFCKSNTKSHIIMATKNKKPVVSVIGIWFRLSCNERCMWYRDKFSIIWSRHCIHIPSSPAICLVLHSMLLRVVSKWSSPVPVGSAFSRYSLPPRLQLPVIQCS